MGIFSFFKKKQEVRQKTIDEMSLEEISFKINNIKEQNHITSIEINKRIIQNIELLISELKNHIAILKSIDLEEKREIERIKLFVKENLFFYVSRLEKLVKELEKIVYESSSENLSYKIQNIFNEFIESSYKHYDKATVLVGKELGDVKTSIKKFFDIINPLMVKQEKIILKLKDMADLQSMVEELNNLKTIQNNLSLSVEGFRTSKENVEKEKQDLEIKNDEFKQSSEFQEISRKREKLKEEVSELNQKITKLKEKMDLRTLAKKYHEDKTNSKIIQGYRDSFVSSLNEDKDSEIIKLVLSSVGLDLSDELNTVKHKIAELKEKNKQINEPIGGKSFEERIKETEFRIADLNKNIEEEEKKIEKFSERQSSLNSEIMQKAKDIIIF
jgi:hypothetical protein